MPVAPLSHPISTSRCFAGEQRRYQHDSVALNCSMKFSVFLPPQALLDEPQRVPVLYWLSGLTCTDENFVHKAGAQRLAAELGIAIVTPDTSPRGDEVPDAPDNAWDLGLGAGFYVNATQPPWSRHYRMYDYVVEELPALVEAHLPLLSERRAIAGDWHARTAVQGGYRDRRRWRHWGCHLRALLCRRCFGRHFRP